MTTPDHLEREDRQAMLKNIEGLQHRLSMVAHKLISDPRDPLPGDTWNQLDLAFLSLAPVTKHWVN